MFGKSTELKLLIRFDSASVSGISYKLGPIKYHQLVVQRKKA
jgi:hypothetical protein